MKLTGKTKPAATKPSLKPMTGVENTSLYVVPKIKNVTPLPQSETLTENEKRIRDLEEELVKVKKVNQEMECSLKNKTGDIKKVEVELNKVTKEKEIIEELRKTIEGLEVAKKEVEVNLAASQKQNENLTEELKKTQAVLAERERYITVLVKEEPGRLNLQEQFKVFDLPNRDAVKRNSVARASIKQYQNLNNIA
jgi:predicted RNase H-like nuclease (RuvC/YqgF family)